ncbi:MAG: hypothetical protein AB1531_12315 [Chloroflexota bacterium]
MNLRLRSRLRSLGELARVTSTALSVARASRPTAERRPVLFFNASTRLSGLSQNAAFSLLASWIVRLSGTPVVHFVCNRGMSRCVLGTDESDPAKPMPCGMCVRQSRANFTAAQTHWFGYHRDESLAAALQPLSLDELLRYELPLPNGSGTFPLGNTILSSLRWRMRLQSLTDDEPTRFLAREFMLSAWNIARQFSAFLDETKPQAAMLFNGTHFPEATAAWLCRQRGIRVVTHESGFQPFSGYFTEGEAIRYPIIIPDVDLSPEQNARLEADLQKRWRGDFSMAGVRFWSEINGLPERLKQKAAGFRQVVSAFTNVIFDTTQMYANVIFADMFAWLDELLEIIRAHPQTFFILRAHPDEARPGKASRENVATWFEQRAAGLSNAAFIPPQEGVSSYDLLKISKFVLTYNSTIGLESILLGVPALAAGQAPFNGFNTVFFELTRQAYFNRLKAWLSAGRIEVPPERVRSTRRFLYYRTYRFSLPFGEFLESTHTGYVQLKKFSPAQLTQSPTARALLGGLFDGRRFELDV